MWNIISRGMRKSDLANTRGKHEANPPVTTIPEIRIRGGIKTASMEKSYFQMQNKLNIFIFIIIINLFN